MQKAKPSSPTKEELQEKLENQQKKIKSLQEQIRRKNKKVEILKGFHRVASTPRKSGDTWECLELLFTPGITWKIHIFTFFTWKYLELFSISVRNFIIPKAKKQYRLVSGRPAGLIFFPIHPAAALIFF